jgi:membrane-associated phospholipid phosphatase
VSETGIAGSGEERARGVLIGTIALVGLGLVLMAVLGRYTFLWKTAVIPVLLVGALVSRRFYGFIDDWSVYLAFVLLFDFLRGFVFALIVSSDLPVYMNYVIDWEKALCAGHVLPVLFQQWRDVLPDPEPLDKLFTLVHGSHFAFFLIFGLAVWFLRGSEFRKYALAITLLMYTALIGYLVVPTVPPWMAARDFAVLPHIHHVTAHIYNLEVPTLQEVFDVNPIAAMPSLHAGVPILCALIGLYHFGRAAWFMPVYALLVGTAIVYLGEHYFVDLVAGALLALLVFVVVYHLGNRQQWLRWPAVPVKPLLLSVLLVTVAEGLGHWTVSIAKPWKVTQSFAQRELVGRSEMADYYLGRLAYDAGDYRRAQHHFARAERTLPRDSQRLQASVWTARSAYLQGDHAAVIRALEPRAQEELSKEALILLAVAYLQAERGAEGMTLLHRLVAESDADPEPLYWLTRYRYLKKEASRGDVMNVVERMRQFPDSWKVERLRESLIALVGAGGEVAPVLTN